MSTTIQPEPATDIPADPDSPRAGNAASDPVIAPAVAGVNVVRLVGRVSAVSPPHPLPSGDCVITLRLVVPRDVRSPRQPGVDTIDVACWTPDTQLGALAVGVDGVAEVVGALRRRFFRGPGGAQSRYEVEAGSVQPAPRGGSIDPGDR